MKKLVQIALVLIVVFLATFLGETEVVYDDVMRVSRVVDGDTVHVELNGEVTKVRLLGIDTPETVHPQKPVECFGREASDAAKMMLEGAEVMLEADGSQGDVDKYGRALRYVFLEDGTNFNLWMIENGYAFEYTYSLPYLYQDEFMAAELEAREAGRGLWEEGVCE